MFIDCKRACKRTLALPGYLDLRHFGTAEQNSGIRISAAGRNKLKIKAGAPGSCVLLLREQGHGGKITEGRCDLPARIRGPGK